VIVPTLSNSGEWKMSEAWTAPRLKRGFRGGGGRGEGGEWGRGGMRERWGGGEEGDVQNGCRT